MAILVKHSKTSTVPDSADTSLVRPSDWNADHTLTGFGTAAELNAGSALGVATLDASGKVPISQIPDSVIGALSYQGTWNASTNTPTLASGVGTKGYYYVVSVAGTTNLDGITDWQVGDWAVYSGTAWQKIDNTDGVTSVNGFTGTVVLTTTNIAEGTNEYFTASRARTSISAGTGISYDNTTGVITNTSPSLGGDVVGPASATDNAIARFDTTTGKLIQNSVVTVGDTGAMAGILSQQFSNGSAVTVAAGKLWYDGSDGTWNAGMGGGNITQQIGEELFVYGKASAAITDSPLQIVYQTGVVGASGHVTFAPTVANLTNGNLILGVATENLATNDFGRITTYGAVHGITTNGTAYGETWADGDVIWYNPSTGNPTKTKPTAPNIKVQIGIVTHAGSGGSGTFFVLVQAGTELGGTDSNVNISSPTAAQILTYSTTDSYWKNTSLASGTGISTSTAASGVLTVNNTGVTSAVAGTGISVSGATGAVTITNTAPDQTVAITAGTGISVSGTYPSFTIANSGVTSLTGTASQVTVSASTGGVTLALANPINVDTSGNAATVTNGVYTTGSYADPTWITSLAGSKITGTIDGGTF